MGGEKQPGPDTKLCIEGSPPRGRGKDSIRNESAPLVGITPAWAGKSAAITARACWPRDHPRVGGEKGEGFFFAPQHQGSPPRGRGKARLYALADLEVGITPAWAGKSMFFTPRVLGFRDHPRVGGEKPVVSTF